ncbi:MAG TPA: PP2C family protein-serine/threonine phosphatase [Acidimicrobiia bacterium]|nr:PP2C family protein-serine/threonine phosphatase [Acidimicrobiia bacterium]
MDLKHDSNGDLPSADEATALSRLLRAGIGSNPGAARAFVDEARGLLGAKRARLYVADYSLQHLREIGVGGHIDDAKPIDSTLEGRAFTSAETLVGETPPAAFVPLLDGANRVGLLELEYDDASDVPSQLPDDLVALFVLVVMNMRRYSDEWDRARRMKPLSVAAEIQWGLLPPLTCSTAEVSIGGTLEPAYSIGGDSFDYAFNGARLDFAIIDAIGRGMPAVLMSATAINTLRNARRAGMELTSTYERADRVIGTQFGDHNFVTAQLGSLNVDSGVLSWVSAGNIPPMLVRNGTYGGELECTPSLPLGLGGHVVEVATVALQRGDRVLFYTDGLTESRSPDTRELFGTERLADLLVRASLEELGVFETARRLSKSIVEYTGSLADDATLVLVEYHGSPRAA